MDVSENGYEPLGFEHEASVPQRGLAMIFDLEGFSHFFNQPDVEHYVPVYLNHVFEAVAECTAWRELAPVHRKFLGDGALYVWTPRDGGVFPPNFATLLANRIWNLKNHFGAVNRRAASVVPVVDLPQRIRFGLAGGTVYELRHKGGAKTEYIGFCINLASRLQKYCPDLGFIASARIGLPDDELQEHGYLKVIATRIRGFPREIVIVDEAEFSALDPGARDALFLEL